MAKKTIRRVDEKVYRATRSALKEGSDTKRYNNADEVQEPFNWRELLTGLLFIVIALGIFVKVLWELFNV